jgi:hypothetical protein
LEAELMQEPADPIAVLSALQKNLAEELSPTEENNMS